jgi:hypothetical protein
MLPGLAAAAVANLERSALCVLGRLDRAVYLIRRNMTAEIDFDLLAEVECFLRRGPDSPWGEDWWVHPVHADDFEAYLRIIGVPYVRELASDICRGSLPAHRCAVFVRVSPSLN